MGALTIAVHAGHYVAMMLLAGAFGFLVFVAEPSLAALGGRTADGRVRLERFLARQIWWSLAAAVATGIGWLALEAASMSGLPLSHAVAPDIVATVLTQTQFGQAWMVRGALALALCLVLLLGRGRADGRAPRRTAVLGGLIAAALLATIAYAGHANSEAGREHLIHLGADMLHLLASAAWLGALPPLVYLLSPARGADVRAAIALAAQATGRFSLVGVASVATLVVTGLVNSWFLVGNVAGLVGTEYGRLLIVKLVIFASMLCLAAVNRQRLSPQLEALSRQGSAGATAPALRWLRRNATLETGLGAALLVVLSMIATSTPALHTQPLWPFPFDLSWLSTQGTPRAPWITYSAEAAMIAAALGAIAVIYGLARSRHWVALSGGLALPVLLLVPMTLLAVPAVPTSYFHSPVRYDALSIARGEPIYMRNCVPCHGADGYGDGPLAASLPIKPANLTGEHLFHHGEGTLFWWVSNGIEDTPMPAFDGVLSEAQRWDVLNFLHAQADAEQSNIMGADVESWRPITAPDFAFQIAGRRQETLKQQRGRATVLLVLFSLPDSLARLQQLDGAAPQLAKAGLRIIAVPLNKQSGTAAGELGLKHIAIAETGPEVVATYSLFRRTPTLDGVPPMPSHMEFIVDKSGYLRFRWSPGYGPGWSQLASLEKRIDILNHEPPRPPAPEGGGHHH